MIVGITGTICSGKAALARYLVETYGFEAVNILDIFKARLKQLREKEEGYDQDNDDFNEKDFCKEYYMGKTNRLTLQSSTTS